MNITVDNDFARFGSKSYAINKINSVEVRERKLGGRGGPIGHDPTTACSGSRRTIEPCCIAAT